MTLVEWLQAASDWSGRLRVAEAAECADGAVLEARLDFVRTDRLDRLVEGGGVR